MSRQTKEYAKKLVAQMTVEEKMSQMLYESPAIERLNIPAYNWWNEALHGVARAGVWKHEDITYDKVECPEHVKLSVEAARRSLVLLKNENAFLPLDKNKIQTVAVIGPNANSRDALVGNYVGTSSRYLLRHVTLRLSRRRENAL